ncbi:MAG: radical SAM family heme chaperone HemW [Caulobacteraceae bacterium]
MKDVGLYIHIPFCRRKCFYCDFNSYEGRESDAEVYIEALVREIEMYRKKYNLQYRTVFIGGGTPTVINYFLIGRIMEQIRPYIIQGAEVSMECNPGTVTCESLEYYRSAGINRLSFGLQAWQDELLKKIGRIHSLEEFLSSYKAAREAGFDNISADLMFALPGQTMEMWQETVKKICALGIEHISCYSLILEEGTKLCNMHEKGIIKLPDDDLDREMYWFATETFEEHGYGQYEISNFARQGYQCKHNLIYWRNEEYLGVGAGSHSKLENIRFWNHKGIDEYCNVVRKGTPPVEGEEKISPGEDMWETIFLALRLNEGLNIKEFEVKYGIDFFGIYGANVSKLQNNNLIIIEDKYMRLTKRGRDLSNSVFIEFM